MKVCFILPKTYGLYHPELAIPYGGAEVQFFLLAKGLAALPGFEVHLAVGDYGQEVVEEQGDVALWKAIDLSAPLPVKAWKMFNTLRTIDAEVYLQMTLTPFSRLMARWLRASGKSFFFFLAHDKDVDGSVLADLPAILQRWATGVFGLATMNIAQNTYQLTALTRHRHRVTMLKSSLEGEVIDRPDREYHLWMARSEAWKQPQLFLRLARQFPSERFLMICPKMAHTPPEEYRALAAEAETLPNLEFRPDYLPYAAMDDVFARAVSFVNTSEAEGFATTFIHAAKCSVPVLSLSVNPDDYLTEYDCGWCFNGSFEGLCDGLGALVHSKADRDRLSRNAAAYFREVHQLDRNIARLSALLRQG